MDDENKVAEDEGISLFEEAMGETTQVEATQEVDEDSTKIFKDSVNEVKGTLETFKREQRVNEFINNPDNADYKEFAGKIRELALKPEAKGLTVNAIANMVVPKDYWVKKGAELAQQATQESKASFNGGTSSRSEVGTLDETGLPDPTTLSKEDFEKQAWNIARGVRP